MNKYVVLQDFRDDRTGHWYERGETTHDDLSIYAPRGLVVARVLAPPPPPPEERARQQAEAEAADRERKKKRHADFMAGTGEFAGGSTGLFGG